MKYFVNSILAVCIIAIIFAISVLLFYFLFPSNFSKTNNLNKHKRK